MSPFMNEMKNEQNNANPVNYDRPKYKSPLGSNPTLKITLKPS